MGDDQVSGRGVGEHPGGGAPEQGGEPPGGEGLGVHRLLLPAAVLVLAVVQGRQAKPPARAALSALETRPR